MKALHLIRNETFVLKETPVPQIVEDEMLIKVAYTGICGSDLSIRAGKNPRVTYPLIMGHELSGEVVEMGSACTGEIRLGDAVTVNPLLSCGQCELCMQGWTHLCRNFGLYGIDVDGAFADYIKVKGRHVHKVPDEVSLDTAALTEPFAVGIHAVERSHLTIGDKVFVLGGGPIGLMVALAARAAGAELVAVSEMSDDRLHIIRELGFIAIDAKKYRLLDKVHDLTNGMGADIVFDAAAVKKTSAQMTSILRTRGTAVIVGLQREPVPVDLGDVNLRELKVLGTMVYTNKSFRTAVKRLPETKELQKLISHKLPLEKFEEGFSSAISKNGMKILLKS
ncbi:zinc-dependent alcohol dehydrogenase [Oceanobacillus timonensis]|uniref:zinc-dependent alcohol dehydrogenase n=1 Tax=Oceanobacillus timonensis TaxID=1926285 RepID=UPI0009B9FCC9|nr:alcohol dehydrogenase catalytic domain-containing protein [Oceanobacillus timonensis]